MSHMTMGDEIHALRCDRASLLRELEELQAERDAAVEQVVYWRELEKVKAERDALARMQKFVLIFASNCRMADTDDCIEWQRSEERRVGKECRSGGWAQE